jgi:hypothetical protein
VPGSLEAKPAGLVNSKWSDRPFLLPKKGEAERRKRKTKPASEEHRRKCDSSPKQTEKITKEGE